MTKNHIQNKPTYISLFSSAGVGCYGFKLVDFECVATNELIERRLDIQRYNNKCKYESGYILGDIRQEDIQSQLYSQVELWKRKEGLKEIDVIIATPPCQGMSVANHKKNGNEIIRNSLVITSIDIIQHIKPKFFIFENVSAFMKTICTDLDGLNKPISEAIENNLGKDYSYTSKVINFKNYGACSSRQRTLVIGVLNKYSDEISPYELYPDLQEEHTLRETIGMLRSLNEYGEIDSNDIYHFFRKYPKHMRKWISDLKEGMSAFDNIEDEKKPHQIINGEIIINKQKNGDKYTRQFWDKTGPCIHTRNDQLASQNTIHPNDDRVFSIRELMLMMSVPYSFKWTNIDINELNSLPLDMKENFLKENEIKIRQSLGEAVPTAIFQAIATKIKNFLSHPILSNSEIIQLIEKENLSNIAYLESFIDKNPLNLSNTTIRKIAELTNSKRTETAAFFTNKSLITEIINSITINDINPIYILEPSSGVGNFLPLIIKKFEGKNLIIDIMDIDSNSLKIAKLLMSKETVPQNCKLNFIKDDFLIHDFDKKYNLIIGNPPFGKVSSNNPSLKQYKSNAINRQTSNICSFFLDKAMNLGNYIAFIFPKFILNTPEFEETRKYLRKKAVECIIDFGEYGFRGVLVETIALFVNNIATPSTTKVYSKVKHLRISQKQSYIFDERLPYWIIYRNQEFDKMLSLMQFGVFSVFRDRQITNQMLSDKSDIRVIKSRNITDDGRIVNINGYDKYISDNIARSLSVYDFKNEENLFLTPNMTYNPRVVKKPKNTLVNGSVAILIPYAGINPTMKQLKFFSTSEYRNFYQIARNFQTRSLNVDSCSVFFFGLINEEH